MSRREQIIGYFSYSSKLPERGKAEWLKASQPKLSNISNGPFSAALHLHHNLLINNTGFLCIFRQTELALGLLFYCFYCCIRIVWLFQFIRCKN